MNEHIAPETEAVFFFLFLLGMRCMFLLQDPATSECIGVSKHMALLSSKSRNKRQLRIIRGMKWVQYRLIIFCSCRQFAPRAGSRSVSHCSALYHTVCFFKENFVHGEVSNLHNYTL